MFLLTVWIKKEKKKKMPYMGVKTHKIRKNGPIPT